MITFQQTNRQYVPSVDLTTLGTAFDTLEQGHQNAIKVASDLNTAINQLDVNEAEAEWKIGKVNEIKTILNDNSRYGNAYGALDDLTLGSGEILFGQDVIGRLKRQQDWKANNAKIDAMNITEDYKRIFKELNPYGKYEDKYDKNGKVLQGESWKPNLNPVNTVPLNEIFNQALKWAAKESGSINGVSFLDANGKPTTDYTKSATGEIFQQTSGGWEKLSADKLMSAVNAAINSIPGAKESLNQDYMIAEYKYNHGEQNDILNKQGIIMSPNEYLQSKVVPFINSAKYYNQQTKVQYGDAVKANILARQAQLAGNGGNNNGQGIDPIQSRSNPITIKNTLPTEAQASITSGRQTIANVLKSIGINDDVTKMTDDGIKEAIKNEKLTPKQRLDVLNALDDINNNTAYLNKIRDGKSKEEQAKFDAYNLITSQSDIDLNNCNPELKKILEKYNSYVNELYGKGTALRQNFNDEDTLQSFKAQLGGDEACKSLGITFGTANGKYYAQLPKENNKSLYLFADAVTKSFNDTHNFFSQAWQDFSNLFVYTAGDNLEVINEDGSVNVAPKGAFKTTIGAGLFSGINYFMDKLGKAHDDVIGNAGNLIVSNHMSSQATPDLASISFAMKANPTEASKLSTVYKTNKEEIESIIHGIDLVQDGCYVLGDNNTFSIPSTEDRMDYTKRLHSLKENEYSDAAIQDPRTGNWALQVTLLGKTDDKGNIKKDPVTLIIPNLKNSTYESWNNNTTFRAKNDINVLGAADKNIDIVSANLFNLNDNISLISNGYGFDVKVGDNIIGSIDKETAVNYRENYLDYVGTKNRIAAGMQMQPEAIQAIMLKTAMSIAEIYGKPNDEETIGYIYDKITEF